VELFKLFDKLHEYIGHHGAIMFFTFGFFLLGGVLLVSPQPTVVSSHPKFSATYIVGSFAMLLPAVVGIVVLTFRSHRKGRQIQVIAWKGWDDEEIYGHFKRTLPDFLLYERGFDTVPRVTYRSDEFDVLVCDIEFLHRYHKSKQLADLAPLGAISDLWQKTIPIIRQKARVACQSDDGRILLGIPIQFGFQEILVNPTSFTGDFRAILTEAPATHQSKVSYSDFKLLDLLTKTNALIGIWNWYLPALSLLQLTEGVSLGDVSKAPGHVEEITRFLCDPTHRSRFVLLNRLESVSQALEDGTVGVVLGAGSWAIPVNNSAQARIKPIVPREGLLMFINCATVLNSADAAPVRAVPLIQHWRNCRTQSKLCDNNTFRAIPVTQESFNELYGGTHAHPSLFTLTAMLTKDGEAHDTSKISLRELPTGWRHWQECWERVEAALRVL